MKSQDPPDVIACEADPDYECVRIGAQESRATIATPPPSGATAPGGPTCAGSLRDVGGRRTI